MTGLARCTRSCGMTGLARCTRSCGMTFVGRRCVALSPSLVDSSPVPTSRIAIYAGSFDPITRGHEDLVHRSLEFVDTLVVAVAINSTKAPLFTIDERVELIRESLGSEPSVVVRSFGGLL